MPQFADGTVINPSGNLPLQRMAASTLSTYTIFKIGSTYYAECNTPSGTDYSGSDEATVINNALTAMSNGGALVFKPGTYTIDTDLSITTNKRFLVTGQGAILEAGTNNVDIFSVNTASSVTTKQVIFDGLDFANTGSYTGVTGIEIDSSFGTNIQACKFSSLAEGIHIYNNQASRWSESNRIRDCTFSSCTVGLKFQKGAGTAAFPQTRIVGSDFRVPASGYGVYIATSCNVHRSYFDVMGWLLADNTSFFYVDGDVTGSILHVRCESSVGAPAAAYGFHIGANATFGYHSSSSSRYTVDLDFVGTGFTSRIYNPSSISYLIENCGSDSIANGTTSKTITHGLTETPTAEHIHVIGKEDPTNDVGTIWIDTITATQFNVNVENDPGASNWDFGWYARIPTT